MACTEKKWSVELDDVSKWFGSYQVLTDVNLTVNDHERVVILGSSGSGKSTLIRCINNLEQYQKGRILVKGIEPLESKKHTDIIYSKVGMVFQQFNLFPHMTAIENCTLGLRSVKKMPRTQAKDLAMSVLEKVKVSDQAYKFPSQLSGGQQQRVAIARSLAMEPQIMLFDEPTSALDPEMVHEVLEVLTGLADSGMTMICVTHEMNFARRIADRVVFMDDGKIIEIRSPNEFFDSPREAKTRAFLDRIIH